MSWHHPIHRSCLRRRSALSLLGKRPNCEKCGTTSDVSYRYPELHGLYIGRLRSALSSFESKAVFQKQLSRYFSGELPHGGAILTALLQALMNGTIVNDPRCGMSNNCNTILRVSRPWPVRTKKALRTSLDTGIFEDFHLMISPGSVPSEHPVHFAGVVDKGIGSPFSRRES
jgi:hypothetical protein